MPTPLHRTLTSLLVLCLIVNPLLASPRSEMDSTSLNVCDSFEQQALSGAVEFMRSAFQSSSYSWHRRASDLNPHSSIGDSTYLKDLPQEVISLTRQVASFDALDEWLHQIIMAIQIGETPSVRLLLIVETLAYLFGFESKPDKGIQDSLSSIVKNRQLTEDEKEHLWDVFYNSDRYEDGQEWEDIEARIYRLLGQVHESRSPFHLFSRIKQYKSILLKLENALSRVEGQPLSRNSATPDEIITVALKHSETIARDPLNYFDDVMGFNFVIDDVALDDAGRSAVLTDYSKQVEALFKQDPRLQVTVIRKAGRVPGFEAVNIFIQGLRRHHQFGDLPIKIQFRFKSVLYGESAMYYTYKRYGLWELPPWARAINLSPAIPFHQIQEALFEAFKQFTSHENTPPFDHQDHLTPRPGWPYSVGPSPLGKNSTGETPSPNNPTVRAA